MLVRKASRDVLQQSEGSGRDRNRSPSVASTISKGVSNSKEDDTSRGKQVAATVRYSADFGMSVRAAQNQSDLQEAMSVKVKAELARLRRAHEKRSGTQVLSHQSAVTSNVQLELGARSCPASNSFPFPMCKHSLMSIAQYLELFRRVVEQEQLVEMEKHRKTDIEEICSHETPEMKNPKGGFVGKANAGDPCKHKLAGTAQLQDECDVGRRCEMDYHDHISSVPRSSKQPNDTRILRLPGSVKHCIDVSSQSHMLRLSSPRGNSIGNSILHRCDAERLLRMDDRDSTNSVPVFLVQADETCTELEVSSAARTSQELNAQVEVVKSPVSIFFQSFIPGLCCPGEQCSLERERGIGLVQTYEELVHENVHGDGPRCLSPVELAADEVRTPQNISVEQHDAVDRSCLRVDSVLELNQAVALETVMNNDVFAHCAACEGIELAAKLDVPNHTILASFPSNLNEDAAATQELDKGHDRLYKPGQCAVPLSECSTQLPEDECETLTNTSASSEAKIEVFPLVEGVMSTNTEAKWLADDAMTGAIGFFLNDCRDGASMVSPMSSICGGVSVYKKDPVKTILPHLVPAAPLNPGHSLDGINSLTAERQRQITNELKAAMWSGDCMQLEEALQRAKAVGLEGSTLVVAEQVLEQERARRNAQRDLTTAVEHRSEKKLREALAHARKLDVESAKLKSAERVLQDVLCFG